MSRISSHPEVRRRESDIGLRAFPFEVLHVEGPAQNMHHYHWHDFMELSYVRSGEGVFEIENKSYTIAAGDIVVINDVERHRVVYDERRTLHETVFHFDRSVLGSEEESDFDYGYLRPFLIHGADFVNKSPLRGEDKCRAGKIVQNISQEYLHKKPYYEMMIRAELLTLITLLVRAAGTVTNRRNGGTRNRFRTSVRIRPMLKYMTDYLHTELTLGGLAERFSVNSSYLSSLFKRQMGVSFTAYLANIRVRSAVELLNAGALNSCEIAQRCGFSSQAQFYRCFKRVMGMNPGQYRGVRSR